MRSRTALLPFLASAVWVALTVPGSAQIACEAERLVIEREEPGGQIGCSLTAEAVSGTRVVVAGANLADDRERGIEDAGSVTLFVELEDGFVTGQPLFAPDAAPGDQFGFALAVSSSALAVGARFGDAPGAPDAGAVYVFEGGESPATSKITAPDAAPGARFGAALALAGNVLAVGAPRDDERGTSAGAVYIFTRTGEGWSFAQKIISPRTAPFDSFGAAVALDLATLAVGAPFADGAGGGAGAVHVFELGERGWSEVRILTASDAAAGDQLGFSVALEGRVLAAGARRDDHGGLTDAGSVVIFERPSERGAAWRESGRLTAGTAARSGDTFGGAVALDLPRLLVGASLADGGDGAAFLFRRTANGWSPPERIAPPAGAAGRFGFSVALSDGTAVAGAFAARAGAGVVSQLTCPDAGPPPTPPTLELSNGVDTVQQGQTVAYRIRVAHAPAGTRVVDRPSARLDRVEWCRGEGCTAFLPGAFSEVLAEGGEATFTVRGQVRSGTRPLVHRVEVVPPRGSGASPLAAEDRDRVLVPDLACFQTEPDLAVVGDLVSSTLVISNQGAGPATRVLLPDPAPAGFQAATVEGPCSGFPCDLGTVPPGDRTSIVVQLRIPRDFAPVPQTVEKTTTVRSGEAETQRANNDCRFRIQVFPLGISPP